MSLAEDPELVYKTLRVYMQAALFSGETIDRKLKISPDSTMDVLGLVITFDQQEDHITETNVSANLLKVVETVAKYANTLARRPFNGEAKQTFTYKNEFIVGTDYTRTKPRRRHLGQVISPEDSVVYMERIFESMTFHQIVNDPDIIECMYGSVKEGNALVTIVRPEFTPSQDGDDDDPQHDKKEDKQLPTFVAEP